MLVKTSKKTLGVLAISLLGLSPLAAQAAFCPLGLLLPGQSSCDTQKACPAGQADEAERGPFRKLLGQIDHRQAQQMARIQRGVDEGLLTARDTQKLMRDQCDIQRMQRRAMADGFLSPYEWADLEYTQEQAGREIQALTGERRG